jgi:hypothetical protein
MKAGLPPKSHERDRVSVTVSAKREGERKRRSISRTFEGTRDIEAVMRRIAKTLTPNHHDATQDAR